MSIQWTLVARIDGDPAATIEAVRSLSPPELSSLDEAQRVLASLTSGSPYQELLVVEGAAGQLQSLRNLSELRLGPGGVVLSARFDPAAPGHVRGWMLQAARMAEHAAEVAAEATGGDACSDGSTEENWLARAAAICLDHGLHEAPLLYLAALAAWASGREQAAEAPHGVPRELTAETLRRFAAGDTRNASAVAIALVRAMWQPIAATTQPADNPTTQATPVQHPRQRKPAARRARNDPMARSAGHQERVAADTGGIRRRTSANH